ncbi:MAG: hypothetical protein R3345_09075 [Fulvivirga sp.]|nr:hypothetical protein [Fulvivirga sp.]
MKVIICFWFLIVGIGQVSGAEKIISGTYQGKDVYVQNPFNPTTKSFCTRAVYVNDRLLLQSPKASAFKIDLSYLSKGDIVVIKIIHEEGCAPRIVNTHVLSSPSGFQFLSTAADNQSITWSTKGEEGDGYFYLEQQTEENSWHVADTIKAKGQLNMNEYVVSAPHEKGLNRYRILYRNGTGTENASVEISYTEEKMITFYPLIATTSLTLSDTAVYVITDYFGREVKKGEGTKVLIQDLKPGQYYITIQNRKEKFVKK